MTPSAASMRLLRRVSLQVTRLTSWGQGLSRGSISDHARSQAILASTAHPTTSQSGTEEKMASNQPVGDNRRVGAVRKRTQLKGKLLGKTAWSKRDKTDGRSRRARRSSRVCVERTNPLSYSVAFDNRCSRKLSRLSHRAGCDIALDGSGPWLLAGA